MERKNAWEKYPEGKKREEVFQFAEDYRKFISECKTERECTTEFAKRAEKAGFVNLDEVLEKGTKLKAGDRVYANNMGKGIAMFVIGKKGLEAGMNILGAHIDSPRMDLKQDPLYEDTDFAMLDTHYYGGIKKYQWVTLPLALHGVIAKKDGTVVKVNVGDKPGDPVFGVSDLLIHLSGEQLEKKAAKVIEGENLDLIIGSIPAEEAGDDKEAAKEKVKANIMKILAKEYDIEEEDFLSAEIEVVPAGEARDYGFDRSIIMGYGHDDRVCAYPSFMAMLAMEKPEITSVCLLVDKEEIGSVGASGMQSRFFENTVAEVMNAAEDYSELKLRRDKIRALMAQQGIDAALITCNVNLIYTYGRVVSGYLYLPLNAPARLFIKRPNDIEGEHIHPIRKPEQLPDLLKECGLPIPARLMLEGDELSFTEYNRLAACFPETEVLPCGTALIRKARSVKTEIEIELFRRSGIAHAKAYEQIPSVYRPGMTDRQLSIEIERLMRLEGCLGIFRIRTEYGNLHGKSAGRR